MINLNINGYSADPILCTDNYPFYVATIGSTVHDKAYRPGGIEDYQILYTIKGRGTAIFEGEEVELSEGMVFFLPPYTTHEYYSADDEWQTLWVTFNGSGIEKLLGDKSIVCKWDGEHTFESLYKKILEAKNTVNLKECSIGIYKLLLDFTEFSDEAILQKRQARNKLYPALRYINEHYCEDVDIKKTADMLGITHSHFCRVFKSFTGVKPMEYITKMRIAKAKMIILNMPEYPIAEVGRAVGYASESYFIKQFKKYEDMTPDAFKKVKF